MASVCSPGCRRPPVLRGQVPQQHLEAQARLAVDPVHHAAGPEVRMLQHFVEAVHRRIRDVCGIE
jgi:hypothetical protein